MVRMPCRFESVSRLGLPFSSCGIGLPRLCALAAAGTNAVAVIFIRSQRTSVSPPDYPILFIFRAEPLRGPTMAAGQGGDMRGNL